MSEQDDQAHQEPLPGNRMDFSSSVAEEVDADGHLVMVTVEADNGQKFMMPRRGMDEQALKAFANLGADIEIMLRSSGQSGDFVLQDTDSEEIACHENGEAMFFCNDDPELEQKLEAGYRALDKSRIAAGLPSKLEENIASLKKRFNTSSKEA